MQNRKVPVGYIILTFFLLVSFSIIGFLYTQNKKLKEMFFSLLPGESVPVLDLITLENEPFDRSKFQEDKVVLFFIFESPCSKCNNNIDYWNNLTQYFADKIQSVGVIPDGDLDTFKLFAKDDLNFKLYSPGDISTFKRKMRLKTRFAQTLIIYKGKVVETKIGDLIMNDVNFLIDTISKILKEK